jgi:glycosyltransferase involved in cell wall biosynthesis
MRVVHVDPERGWGGGEVQVLALLERQARGGLDVLLAAHPDGPLARRAEARGIAIAALAVRNHLDVRAGWRLRRLARGADVVHFHTARAHALAPWVPAGVRRVVTRRMDYVPRGGLATRLLYDRGVDVVIAISHGVRRALLAAGVQASRIVVVPSGVDLERVAAPAGSREMERRALGAREDDVVVLGLGALEPRKGFDVLVDAVATGAAPLRLVLAGGGSQGASLERRAHAAGVQLTRLGFREDVGPLLAAADIVAVPSRAEGLGIAALEAMAAGRPVVASRVGGLAEAIEHDVTGLLVPPEDAASLGAAIERLARDPAARDRLGLVAAARVRERFSLDAMAAGTLACYENAP